MNDLVKQEATQSKVTKRLDYEAPHFYIETVDLHFDLFEEETIVTASLAIKRSAFGTGINDLTLDGEELELVSIEMNNETLTPAQYAVDVNKLIIFNVPDSFALKTVVRIFPQKNKALSGLYRSGKQFCTQCEAEGFRRITYFLDRPDVLAYYKTTIVADKKSYPYLLSNGNLIEEKLLPNNRRSVTWSDPFKKPCYLFALIAGDFEVLEDKFETKNKRTVDLKIYVERGLLDQAHHAMFSVKAAMKWDEDNYDREYDLNIYMIVAIGDFNMGAMENKGLNVFNTKYVLAKPETATDDDYIHISSVIAHEYFHNWSGNRVTCRDWFQLSLKEGLTIFRDQSFTEDLISKSVMRIRDVKALRESQFDEDAGPTAHPVRPDSYLEINNFYTATVYNKGAEVLRMLRTIIGDANYHQAMDNYFFRYDGQAVTIDDYIDVMEETAHTDLTQFKLWYSQAGTPLVNIQDNYDEKTKHYILHLEQSCPTTPDQSAKLPMFIPIRFGILNQRGEPLSLPENKQEVVLHLREKQQTFEFENIAEKPIPSFLRGFSAPIKLKYNYSDDELFLLALHDTDPFNQYEAAQKYFLRILLSLTDQYQNTKKPFDKIDPKLIEFYAAILKKAEHDLFFASEIILLPSEKYISEQMREIDVDAIHNAREFILLSLSQSLTSEWQQLYQIYDEAVKEFEFSASQIGKRQFKNTCFAYLLKQIEFKDLGVAQFKASFKKNMTDQLAALIALSHFDIPEREEVLETFYQAWSHDALVMDKWLSIQAGSQRKSVISDVEKLLSHPIFDLKNPNKVYSLIGTFGRNAAAFHDVSGKGYRLLRKVVLELDEFNPHVAARMIRPMLNWQRYDAHRQQLMQEQLELILQNKKISTDLYELINKSLQ